MYYASITLETLLAFESKEHFYTLSHYWTPFLPPPGGCNKPKVVVGSNFQQEYCKELSFSGKHNKTNKKDLQLYKVQKRLHIALIFYVPCIACMYSFGIQDLLNLNLIHSNAMVPSPAFTFQRWPFVFPSIVFIWF